MSYAIAPTFEANKIGVRRVYTLSGAPDALALQMIADGYDISVITSLTDANVTDAQLQNLYDNYGAGTPEFATAANLLLTQLTGGPGGAASAVGFPQGAIPQIQTDLMGTIDLSLKSTWDAIGAQFSTIGNQLNAVAAQNSNDPTVIQMKAQYNSLASQFGQAWSTVFNSVSPIHTLGTWEDIAVTSGIVILGGIAIGSGVGIPLVATIGTILAGLYVIGKYINSKNAQTAVAQTQATTQSAVFTGAQAAVNALIADAQAKLLKSNQPGISPAEKASLQQQYSQEMQQASTQQAQILTSASAVSGQIPGTLSAWFTQNWIAVAAVILGIAVLPGLVKKL